MHISVSLNLHKPRTELLGLDSSYISKFERGLINISLEKLIDIANYFNIEVKELFD